MRRITQSKTDGVNKIDTEMRNDEFAQKYSQIYLRKNNKISED